MKRSEILSNASKLTSEDRNKQYGEPHVQCRLAHQWFIEYQIHAGGKHTLAHDHAIYMILTKISRLACGDGAFKADTYEDIAAYAAIAGEAEEPEPEPGSIIPIKMTGNGSNKCKVCNHFDRGQCEHHNISVRPDWSCMYFTEEDLSPSSLAGLSED